MVVAILDDGIAPHEDLPAERILPGIDFSDFDNDPTPGPTCSHGIACAGLVAATHCTDSINGQNDSTGIISINPSCYILPVKMADEYCSSGEMTAYDDALAITWAYAHGADILSCSWSYGIGCLYQFFLINDALEAAFTLGRDGLGCPVIFASGNTRAIDPRGNHYPGCLPWCLSVGAVDDYGVRWPYSEYGFHGYENDTSLDVVAPSGDICLQGDILTLDQMDSSGFNPNIDSVLCGTTFVYTSWNFPSVKSNDIDYDARFGGTSAAAPLVTGVASLILGKDPSLSAGEVYEILRMSAATQLSTPITPPDIEYGYGRVDAFRAILSMARGDCNNSGHVSFTDVTVLVNHLFVTFDDLFPSNLLGDVNCDGEVNLSDVTLLNDHLFVTFEPLAVPCFEYGD